MVLANVLSNMGRSAVHFVGVRLPQQLSRACMHVLHFCACAHPIENCDIQRFSG